MPKHLTNENIKLQYNNMKISILDAKESSTIAEVSLPYSIEIIPDLTIKSSEGQIYLISVNKKGEITTELVNEEGSKTSAILADNNGVLFELIVDNAGHLSIQEHEGFSYGDRIYLQASMPDSVIYRLGVYTPEEGESVLCTSTINATIIDDDVISTNLTFSSTKIFNEINNLLNRIQQLEAKVQELENK